MIKSMTGFASLAVEDEQAAIGVTLRAVNHRFLEVQLRVPPSLAEIEARIRALVQARVARGRLDVAVTVQLRAPAAPIVELNEGLAAAIAAAVARAREQGLVAGALTPGDLLRLPQAMVIRERPADADPAAPPIAARVEAALAQALTDLDAMRVREGGLLEADFDRRIQTLASLIDRLRAAADQGRGALEARLQERIRDLSLTLPIDEALIAQEIVRAAGRSDITEEVTRFRAHLAHWGALTAGEDPCGRKLDFLLQEMNREVNTIGSKADGPGVPELVIEAKAELERLREQVQNVE